MLVWKGKERQRWPGTGTVGDPRSPPPALLSRSLMLALLTPDAQGFFLSGALTPLPPRPCPAPSPPPPPRPAAASPPARSQSRPRLPPCPPQVRARPRAAPQPRQTVPPSGHTRPWAAATCVTKTNTRGGLGGEHGRTSTGDPNFRFEPRSPEVSVKKMPKLKC